MKITWLGHACFKVEEDGYCVILDPYQPGSVPGYGELCETADLVLCSHGHGDHNAREAVTLREGRACPFVIDTIDTWHDDQKGALRGPNRIHILRGSQTVVHMGDIGCGLTEEQAAALHGADVLLIPVGGHFTIDAEQAKRMSEEIGARITVPMHYSGPGFGYPVIGPVEKYTALCDDVCRYGSVLEIDGGTKQQTAVMTPQYLRGA